MFRLKLTILYCDAEIHRVQEWEPEDGPLELELVGGGGTSHKPVWRWVEEHAPDVKCLVSFTDLCSDVGAEDEPAYPVFFGVVNGGPEPTAPFGEVLTLDCGARS